MSYSEEVYKSRRKVSNTMTDKEDRYFLYGIICYDDSTAKGKRSISYFRALCMSKTKLKAIFYYLSNAEEIDFSQNDIACKTLLNIMKALDKKDKLVK